MLHWGRGWWQMGVFLRGGTRGTRGSRQEPAALMRAADWARAAPAAPCRTKAAPGERNQQGGQGGLSIPPHSTGQLTYRLPPTQPANPAMTTARRQALARKPVATQTERLPKDPAVQVSG